MQAVFHPIRRGQQHDPPAPSFNFILLRAQVTRLEILSPHPAGIRSRHRPAYGDQGNGFTYGWYRSDVPVDITANGRYRQAANAPDLRYDTFMHMIKATPPAVWEVVIPNGFYYVHIVAGDPANTDSVFQFDVEGVLTGTVTPNTPGPSMSIGRLRGYDNRQRWEIDHQERAKLQSTANNNKIDFIDIYPAIPVPILITGQPQPPPTPFYENRPLSLQSRLLIAHSLRTLRIMASNRLLTSGTRTAVLALPSSPMHQRHVHQSSGPDQ